MASPSWCSVFAISRWQSSRPAACAPGGPAKKRKPLSAAVANAALPKRPLENWALLNGDFRRNVCSCIHPPWAPPWCWLGFFASLQKEPAGTENVAANPVYGKVNHQRCSEDDG